MKTSLSDLYSSVKGEKIVLDNKTLITDIYGEAVILGKWVRIDINPVSDNWVVEVIDPSDLKNKDVIAHIINADLSESLSLKVPNHIKYNSVRSALYLRLKGYRLTQFEDHLIINAIEMNVTDKVFTDEFVEGSQFTLNKHELVNVNSALTKLYIHAKSKSIRISIDNGPVTLTVHHKGDVNSVAETAIPPVPFSTQCREWLNGLPYDVSTSLPDGLLLQKTTFYIKTVINKSGYDCTYNNGVVTKRSVMMRKRLGVIEVVVKGEVVKTINKGSLTQLDSRDRQVIDLVLKPFNKTYKDARS